MPELVVLGAIVFFTATFAAAPLDGVGFFFVALLAAPP